LIQHHEYEYEAGDKNGAVSDEAVLGGDDEVVADAGSGGGEDGGRGEGGRPATVIVADGD